MSAITKQRKKISQTEIINIAISCVMFGIILVLNLHTEYVSDDFKYHFFFDTPANPLETSHRMKPWEVFSSMINHRNMWNGRIISHGLLQLVLMLGNPIFETVNSVMYVLLGTLIYVHAVYQRKKSAFLLIFIYVCMWFFLPQYGLTVLWASGAANYLWNAVIILAFALLYRMHFADESKIKDSVKNRILIGFFGILAGCTNENTGGAAVLLAVMYVCLYRFKKIPVPKWSLWGIVGGICGVLLLVLAPGSSRISSATDWEGFVRRFKDVMYVSKMELSYLMVVLCVILLLYAATRKCQNGEDILPLLYFVAGIASAGVLVFSAMYPARAWFVASVLLLVSASYLYVSLTELPMSLHCVTAGILILLFAISFREEFGKIKQTHAQVEEGILAVEEALNKGEHSAQVPIVQPTDSKYDAFKDAIYVQEPADNWVNAWMARYYGLDAIYGYRKE